MGELHRGSVAEWSKALVLGTSLFGGVGSNPIAAISSILISYCIQSPSNIILFWHIGAPCACEEKDEIANRIGRQGSQSYRGSVEIVAKERVS